MTVSEDSSGKPRIRLNFNQILRVILQSIVNGSAVLGILATLILLVNGQGMEDGELLLSLGRIAVYGLLIIVPSLPFLLFGALIEEEPVTGYLAIILILAIYIWVGSSLGCIIFEESRWPGAMHFESMGQMPGAQEHVLRLRYPRMALSELIGYPLDVIFSLFGWLIQGNLHAYLQEHYPTLVNRSAIIAAFLCGNIIHRYLKPYISDSPVPDSAASSAHSRNKSA